MDRRGFIATATGGALVSLPGIGAAAETRPFRPIASYVTGLREHAGAAAPRLGAAVDLVRAPERRYDPASIAVVGADGRRLGYLPTHQARVLAPLMDAGFAFEARVAGARSGRVPELRLALTPVTPPPRLA